MPFEPRNPDFEPRVRASFERQLFMQTLGAELVLVAPGEVAIELAFRRDLTQQHGFLHAGTVAGVIDSACGYAALSLMEPGTGVLSIEFKVNLLAPADAPRFRAVGRVLRPGRTITAVVGELIALRVDGATPVVAAMQGTMMAVRHREGISD